MLLRQDILTLFISVTSSAMASGKCLLRYYKAFLPFSFYKFSYGEWQTLVTLLRYYDKALLLFSIFKFSYGECQTLDCQTLECQRLDMLTYYAITTRHSYSFQFISSSAIASTKRLLRYYACKAYIISLTRRNI